MNKVCTTESYRSPAQFAVVSVTPFANYMLCRRYEQLCTDYMLAKWDPSYLSNDWLQRIQTKSLNHTMYDPNLIIYEHGSLLGNKLLSKSKK